MNLMKNFYITALFTITANLFLFSSNLFAQTLAVSGVPTTLCANESFTVSYVVDGGLATASLDPGNVVTIELSTNVGSFPGQDIGSIVTTELTGTVYVTIPTQPFTFSTFYRIRVKVSDVRLDGLYLGNFDGADNGADININCTTRDYYWIGGTGNWSDLAHWEYTTDDVIYTDATELPTANDNVIFDDTTFPSGGQVTVDLAANCNDFYWDPISGANNPVIWGNSNNSLNVYGDFELAPGVYRDLYNIYFNSLKSNVYLDFADNLLQNNPTSTYWLGNLFFQSNGTWEQGSNLIAENIQITGGGTLYSNDFQYNLNGEIYNTFGTFYAGNSTIYSVGIAMYSTFFAENSNIYLNTRINGDRPYIHGSQIYNNVTVESGKCLISSSNNSFNNLSLVSGGGITLAANSTQTINISFNAQGTRSNMAVIESDIPGTQTTIFLSGGASVITDYISITDNIIDDGAVGTYSATNAIDGDNNVNWNFSLITPLDYYWIGDTGNWSNFSNWQTSSDGGNTFASATEGASSVDNVVFTTSSFPTGGTLTIDETVNINNMTWEVGSGLNFPTISSISPVELVIHGSLQMDNGVTRDLYRINFNSNVAGNTIALADNLFNWGDIDFNGIGEWTLMDSLATDYLNFRGGTLNTNSFPVNVSQQIYLDYNIGTVNLGASQVYLRAIWSNAQNLVFNAQTSTFIFNNGNASIGGNNPINFNNVILEGKTTINNSWLFNNLTLNSGSELTLQSGVTQTVTNSFNAVGTQGERVRINSDNPGNPSTISLIGTSNVDFAVIQDNIIDNGSAALEMTSNSLDNGGNTGWDFTTNPYIPVDFYWIGGSGNWSDITHWEYTSDGINFFPATEVPTSLDDVYFDANSFPTAGTLTVDIEAFCNNMDWTGTTPGTQFYAPNYTVNINGDFIMANGVYRDVRYFTFDSDNSNVIIDLADNTKKLNSTINWDGVFQFYGNGSYSLQSSFDGHNMLFNDNIEFTTNDNTIDLVFDLALFSAGNIFNAGNSTISLEKTHLYGTFNAETSTIIFYKGYGTIEGNATYNKVLFEAGDYSVNETNTIFELKLMPDVKLQIDPAAITTVTSKFEALGTRSQMIDIQSTSTGVPATLNLGASTALINFVIIQDNNVDVSTIASNSIDNGGNNANWTIGTIGSLSYFWIGGTGNWSDVNHWATTDGGSTLRTDPPGPKDNVNFTTNSFPTGGKITIDVPADCNDMIWTDGSTNPTIASIDANPLTIRGNFQLATGVTRDISDLRFESITSNTVTFADNQTYTSGTITFEGSGSWSLQDAVSTFNLKVLGGTFNSNNMDIYVYNGFTIDGGTVNLFNSNVDAKFFAGNSATFNPNTSTVYLINNGYLQVNFTFNNVVIDGYYRFFSNNIFNSLTLNEGAELEISQGLSQTFNQSLTINGTRNNMASISSNNPGNQAFLVTANAAASYIVDYAIIEDISLDNGSGFITFEMANNSDDRGGNIGWDFATNPLVPTDYYWVGGAGNWSDALNHWSTTDGGVANMTDPPGPLDDVFFTGSSSFAVGDTVLLDVPASVHTMTWGDGSANPVIDDGNDNNALTLSGSLFMANGVYRSISRMNFDSDATNNLIQMAGNEGDMGDIFFDGGGTWTMLDSLAVVSMAIYSGKLVTNSNELYISGILESYDQIDLGSSKVNVWYYFGNAPSSLGGETIYLEFGGTLLTWSGFLNNVVFEGDAIINQNNNVNNLSAEVEGSTLTFQNSSTTTINNSFTLTGTSGALIYITSNSPGTQANISMPGTATVSANFVSIQDNNGTGGATFATTNSSIYSNVTGWTGLTGQTISMTTVDVPFSDGAISLNATSDSGLGVTYTITQGNASVAGNILTPNSPGLVGIEVSQSGDATYAPTKIDRYIHFNATNLSNELGNFKEATYVVGQKDFVSNEFFFDVNKTPQARKAFVTKDGKLISSGSRRVLIWNQVPGASDVPADIVLGQPDFISSNFAINSSTIYPSAYAIAVSDDGRLLVGDSRGILIWNTIPTVSGTPADVIIGQDDFNTNEKIASADRLRSVPFFILTPDQKLIVSDLNGNRVLIFDQIPTVNGASADLVIGQTSFTTSTIGLGPDKLNYPGYPALAPDGKLFIPDAKNNRVLVYNSVPTVSGASADYVLGQIDMNSNIEGLSPTEFNYPYSVDISRTGKMAIADRLNNRVLIYNSVPADNTIAPDYVLGQPDFNSAGRNTGGVSGRSINDAYAVYWDVSDNLYVGDISNNRFLVWGLPDFTFPIAFTTGDVSSVGATVVSGYWNSTNSSIDIIVPVANDASLNAGAIQMQIKIGTGAFEIIGGELPILPSSLGSTQIVNVAEADIEAATGYSEGTTLEFQAIIIDRGANQTIGTKSSTVLTVDEVLPTALTTGSVSTIGGTIAAGFWNSTNTSVDITVPIDNDPSLNGGNIQMQIKIGAGSFENIGTATTILNANLAGSQIASLTANEIKLATGYTQDATMVFTAVVSDVAGNPSTFTQSTSTLTIDDVAPNSFTTGLVATVGGTVNTQYWNSTNTSIDISVPIDADNSLIGGTIQIQVKFDAGSFVDIGGTTAISSTGNNVIVSIDSTSLKAAVGYVQGSVMEFRAVIVDNVGNLNIGSSSITTLIIDDTAPIAFTTGNVTAVGGYVAGGAWNVSNTDLEITVPIDTDASLTDGTIQLSVDVDGGGFNDIGTPVSILVTDLGTNKIVTLSKSLFEAIAGIGNGSVASFTNTISDVAGNATKGSTSISTITIDNNGPAAFTTGNVSAVGGTVVQGYWNASNTDLDIAIPIANTPALDGGTIQLSVDINGGGFVDFGSPIIILNSSLGINQMVRLTKADLESITGITEASEVTFNARLTDLTTNTTIGTESATKITVDRIAPSLNTTLFNTYTIGSTAQPTITINTDDSGLKELVFNYNLVSSMLLDAYNQVVFIPDQAGTVITDIQSAIQNSSPSEQIGLKYYVDITDNAGNTFSTINNESFINLKYPDGVSLNKFGIGSTTEAYKIMAVPIQLESATLMDVFGAIYGSTFDKSKMRVFSYTGGASDYNELSGSGSLVLGKGYFALAASSPGITSPAGATSFGPIQNADGDNEQGFVIDLVGGWNLIGNPFLHDVKWSDIVALSGITTEVDNLQNYKSGAYTKITSIPAGEGAFVFNNSNSFSLKIPARLGIGGRVSETEPNTNSLQEDSWEVLFKSLNTYNEEITLGGIGMEREAITGKDLFDWLNPPSFASMKLIDFNHPEFSVSSFKKDVRETSLVEKWNFEFKLVDPEQQKQEIHWDNSYFGDNTPDLYLIDKTHFATINMKEVNSYTFGHSNATRFEVYFGYDILDQILPKELITQSPFPNPFANEVAFNIGLPQGENYSIELRIFDSVGKLIKSINNTEVEAGYNAVVWDGLNKEGVIAPNGMYAYSLHILGEVVDVIKSGKIIKR
jgi:flagellar hook capping protein FlgD